MGVNSIDRNHQYFMTCKDHVALESYRLGCRHFKLTLEIRMSWLTIAGSPDRQPGVPSH